MDIDSILASLRSERVKVDNAINALETLNQNGGGAIPHRARRRMSEAARKRMSVAMKRRWASGQMKRK